MFIMLNQAKLLVLSAFLSLISFLSNGQTSFDASINERIAFSYSENGVITISNLIPGDTYVFYFSGEGVSKETKFYVDKQDLYFNEHNEYHLKFSPAVSAISGFLDELDWSSGSDLELQGNIMPYVSPSSIDSMGIMVADSQDIQEIVRDILLGDKCVSVGTVSVDGDSTAFGQFFNGSNSIGLETGIIMASGSIQNALGPNEQSGTSSALGSNSDEDMELLSGDPTRDCTVIEFDFLPDQDSVSFEYVFASEEYCDYTFSSFNDGFGFFLSGDGINGPFSNNAINLAFLPDGTTPVTINNVNWSTNGEYYVDNNPTTFAATGGCTQEEIDNEPAAAEFIEYDGFTTVLKAKSAVTPCTPYHIKLVVCDAVDQVFDSAVFIGKNSFTSGFDGAVEATIGYTNTFENEVQEGCNQAYIAFERFDDNADSVMTVNITVDGSSSAEAGVDYGFIPEIFQLGQGVWKDTLWIDVFEDGLTEGIEVINLGITGLCACLNTLHQIFIDDPMGEVTVFESYNICPGDTVSVYGIDYSVPGEYTQEIDSELGCDSILHITINEVEVTFGAVNYTIEGSETIELNGEVFDAAGVYEQLITNEAGCDSLLTITIRSVHNVVYHSLNACSAITDISNINYDEFTPEYPESLDCGSVFSSNVYRVNPEVNAHSCTPGINGEITMCVSSLDNCVYQNGNEAAVLIDLIFMPSEGFEIHFTDFEFYENAPDTFNWINGDSGLNNPPTLYGLRVIRDGLEIFKSENNPTTNSFTLEQFNFEDLDDFRISDTTLITIELMGYCLSGADSPVTAWDLDELNIKASCEPLGGSNKVIAGNAISYNGTYPIKNAEVKRVLEIAEPIILYDQTDNKGNYLFDNNPAYNSYNLEMRKSDEMMKGVTTLDLVLIQRHILDIQPFEAPEQYLAADINGSGDITSLDILILRKLILGIEDSFPDDNTWIFLNAESELSMDNPWEYTGNILIEELTEDIYDANFRAIKTGDVNDSYVPGYENNEVSNRSTWILEYPDLLTSPGSVYEIPFRSSSDIDLAALQMELNTKGLHILGLEPNAIPVNEEHYRITEEGVLTLAFHELEPVLIQESDILFTLQVEAKDHMLLSELLELGTSIINVAYNGGLEGSAVQISPDQLTKGPGFVLFQNAPNPFSELTRIRFNLPESGLVDIEIRDSRGSLIMNIGGNYPAGTNQVEVPKSALGLDAGVLLCTIRYKEHIRHIKMIAI
jgi:hypothetical protein